MTEQFYQNIGQQLAEQQRGAVMGQMFGKALPQNQQ